MANPDLSSEHFSYILNHVFLPPKLPQEDDANGHHDIALCDLVYRASVEFTGFLSRPETQQWSVINQMLKTLLMTTRVFDKDVLAKNILSLRDGGQFCQGF